MAYCTGAGVLVFSILAAGGILLTSLGFLPPTFRAIITVGGAFVTIAAIAAYLVWSIVIMVIGYSRVHKMSIVRSVFALVIPELFVALIQYIGKR
jgi:hypothetical protein